MYAAPLNSSKISALAPCLASAERARPASKRADTGARYGRGTLAYPAAQPPSDSDQGPVQAAQGYEPGPHSYPRYGPRRKLPPQLRRTLVDYYTKERPARSSWIRGTPLHLVLGHGTQRVTRMAERPDWNSPEEMIAPALFRAGGETNPLGTRPISASIIGTG